VDIVVIKNVIFIKEETTKEKVVDLRREIDRPSLRFMKVLLSIIVIFFISFSSIGQSPKDLKTHKIDSLLSACANAGIFNGVALVNDGGEIILHKSYEVSNRQKNKPLVLNDRFYIGSVTKQFTAVLILQLQQQNLLNVTDPIHKYLPEFNEVPYQNISIHHLLTHTSGLNNYTGSPGFDAAKDYTTPEMFHLIKSPLLFKVGSKWSYSNSGYYLLGKIAEKVGKKPYGDLLDEQIFTPLQMHHTAFDTSWLKTNVANGYWRTINGFSPMQNYSLHTLFSSGGIYSTALDLFKWDKALYSNQLLNDSLKKLLFNPVLHDYACGWYVKKGIDETGEFYERHFHGGWIKGYHAFLFRRIPSKQLVVLLDNSYSQELQDIKNRIWSILIEEDVKVIKPKLSNYLFDACANSELKQHIDLIESDLNAYERKFKFEEFDINTVGYRLMNANRFEEATIVFYFNMKRYPNSWNVYDSMGELRLKMGHKEEAKKMYLKSLDLNPDNTSAKNALEKIKSK
jgi:CubicO group peptidase (beta-lactamase class C family)